MRDVAVLSFSQTPFVRRQRDQSEVEMLIGVVSEAIEKSGLSQLNREF